MQSASELSPGLAWRHLAGPFQVGHCTPPPCAALPGSRLRRLLYAHLPSLVLLYLGDLTLLLLVYIPSSLSVGSIRERME